MSIDEFSPVRLDRFCGAYLRDNGSLSRHIRNSTGPPNPAHSIPASSAHDFSSSSVDIQGVHGSTRFSNTWMTPKAESSEGPMIRRAASPDESLEQPVGGDLDTSQS
jgi:hypothetical protein